MKLILFDRAILLLCKLYDAIVKADATCDNTDYLNVYIDSDTTHETLNAIEGAVSVLKNVKKGAVSMKHEKSAPHGVWQSVSPMVDSLECSVCRYQILGKEMATPFCPWCGTIMNNWEDVEDETD